MQTLIHKAALITHSESEMGKIVAERLAALGATIMLHHTGQSHGIHQTFSNIKAMGAVVLTMNQDLNTPEGPEQLFKDIRTRLPHLDVIVVTEQHHTGNFDQILIHAANAIADKGHIIYISPVINTPVPPDKGKSSSETQLETIRELAFEIGKRGVTLNAIIPYAVNHMAHLADTTDTALRAQLIENTILNRLTEPEEIANLAEFLATDLSSVITGQQFFTNR